MEPLIKKENGVLFFFSVTKLDQMNFQKSQRKESGKSDQ